MSDGYKQVRDLAGNLVSVIDSEAPDHTHPFADITGAAASDHAHTGVYSAADHTHTETSRFTVIFDAPADGDYVDLVVPFDCDITGVTLLADQSGSIAFDIWKDTYANYPPTVDDTIVASAPPTISTATKAEDSTLTGWTTALSAGDVLRFYVDGAVTDITQVTLSLAVTK